MIKAATRFLATALVLVATVSLSAHHVTYKGVVVAVEKTSVSVTVVDEKTKKPATMKFDFDKDTKFFRGDKAVAMADVNLGKDEKIAVTIDHDADQTLAIEIHLEPKK